MDRHWSMGFVGVDTLHLLVFHDNESDLTPKRPIGDNS